MSDPLQELLLDADEVDRAQLAQALLGILGVDKKTGRVVLKPGFNDLDARRRVLAFLLGAKVAQLLGLAETEAVAPKDLEKQTGMPHGTVAPKLGQLLDEKFIAKTPQGGYHVAPHQVTRAAAEIRREGS
jgi:prolyl-tRNA editing enzyme YbaK/EbsC (Cys-tRNA(Pro) deacylase)